MDGNINNETKQKVIEFMQTKGFLKEQQKKPKKHRDNSNWGKASQRKHTICGLQILLKQKPMVSTSARK